jgi:hypothetical protein
MRAVACCLLWTLTFLTAQQASGTFLPFARYTPHRSLLQSSQSGSAQIPQVDVDAGTAVAALALPVLEEPPAGEYTVVSTAAQMKLWLEDFSLSRKFAKLEEDVVLLRIGEVPSTRSTQRMRSCLRAARQQPLSSPSSAVEWLLLYRRGCTRSRRFLDLRLSRCSAGLAAAPTSSRSEAQQLLLHKLCPGASCQYSETRTSNQWINNARIAGQHVEEVLVSTRSLWVVTWQHELVHAARWLHGESLSRCGRSHHSDAGSSSACTSVS